MFHGAGVLMNLFQIEYFNSVAKHLNFTTAAKSLFVSQPSLSKQIALLEKEIGVKLIHRNRHTVRLTPAGIVFLKEFENINTRINGALEKVRLADRGSAGNISIGCLETINVEMFFPGLINNFKNKFPEIKISVERGGFRYLREKLQEGVFDIIFTLSIDLRNSPGLVIKNIHKRKGCIVMSAKNKLARCRSLPYKELSEEPLIIFSEDESPGIYANALKTARYHGFRNIRQVHNVETLLSNLDLGLGFSLLDRSIGEYRKNRLKFFDLPENEAVFYAVCAYKKDNLNPTVPFLMNMIAL
jgi:DNA-binding transcriptional LysR family regulator